MKFLIVGLGSMGKRRISCLHSLREFDIIGYDTREDRRKEAETKYGIQTCSSLNIVSLHQPDTMFICTPPNLHRAFVQFALINNINFFTELNMEPVEETKKVCGVPSCTALFYPYFNQIKHKIDNLEVVTFNYHWGQYLPSWHTKENYQQHFASKKETHACKEVILYDLVWLTDIFGHVKKVCCEKRRTKLLDTDIDDVYNIIFTFENGLTGNALYDCISKTLVKKLEMVGEEKNLTWDILKSTSEKAYINETKAFLNLVRGKGTYPYSFKQESENLKVMEMIENAS